jgi:hypothetical protein
MRSGLSGRQLHGPGARLPPTRWRGAIAVSDSSLTSDEVWRNSLEPAGPLSANPGDGLEFLAP